MPQTQDDALIGPVPRLSDEGRIFLADLSNNLRRLTDPAAVTEAASRALGRHLQVNRVAYAEIDVEAGVATIHQEWNSGAMPPVARRHSLSDYGFHPDLLAQGETVAIDDVRSDPRTADRQVLAAFDEVGVAAVLSVPLHKESRCCAALSLGCRESRTWTTEDTALARETAERTWAAMEQTRAEAALFASEVRYRALFDAIDEGYCLVEVDLDGEREDYRVIEANAAFHDRTGFPREILGRWLRDAAPDLEEYWFETYCRVARTGEPARFEHGSDALGRWFDVSAFRFGPVEDRCVAIR